MKVSRAQCSSSSSSSSSSCWSDDDAVFCSQTCEDSGVTSASVWGWSVIAADAEAQGCECCFHWRPPWRRQRRRSVPCKLREEEEEEVVVVANTSAGLHSPELAVARQAVHEGSRRMRSRRVRSRSRRSRRNGALAQLTQCPAAVWSC